MYEIDNNSPVLRIGKTGENEFRTFTFDVSPWTAVYPSGEILGVYRRPDGRTYPVSVQRSGNAVMWTVSDTDLVATGIGELELRIVCGAIIGKSSRFSCIVTESLNPGATPPSPGIDWIANTLKETAEAAGAANTARAELLAAAERGDFNGAPGELDEEQIADGIREYLSHNPLSIQPMSTDVLGGARLGENLLISEDGHLSVDTAHTAAADDSRPITSAAVFAVVDGIGQLLDAL